MTLRTARSLAGLAALVAAFSAVPDVHACGGLFCSNSNPVNQVAERIIFAQNDDDTITAVIEIQYKGPARDFGWVLPVPQGDVEVGVSSKQVLDGLQAASNPVYSLQTTFQDCGDQALSANSASGVPPRSQAESAGDDGGADIEVVSSGAVGPYDWVIIEVNPELEDRAEVAVEWLQENGFDSGALGPEVLRIYLAQDMNLLAFNLSKGNDAGSIRPVRITYPGERPVIPIQPTAVAAQEDMGIMVWVLGEARAVPTNYLALELNEARIDWFNPGPTYDDVVIAAADEAGGWGFVTEQSGRANAFTETIYSSYKAQEWESLRNAQFASLPEFLQQVVYFGQAPFVSSGFGGFAGDVAFNAEYYDGFLEVLSDAEVFPLREGATPAQFISCVSCYFETQVAVANDAYPSTPYVPGEDPLDQMNVTAFLDALEQEVIVPLERTRELFERHRQVTRMYTTLSPDEMSIDPEFDVNPDLPDVSNQHIAERVMRCDGSSWTVTLPQGHVLRGRDGTWPVETSADVPFNARALQLATSGNGEVVFDNYDNISSALVDLGVGGVEPEEEDSGGVSGCNVRRTKASATWFLFTGLAALGFARRRFHMSGRT